MVHVYVSFGFQKSFIRQGFINVHMYWQIDIHCTITDKLVFLEESLQFLCICASLGSIHHD